MSLLDRAISYVSPKWALGREVARDAHRTYVNSYKGGTATRTSETWPVPMGYRFGTAADRQQIIGTRNRAYEAYDNDPVARTLVQTETNDVIGDGVNYQPDSSSTEWNKEAEDRYYEWREECSIRGSDVDPGCEVERHIWAYSRVAGDIGWILANRDYVDRQTGSLRVRSRIQIVRAENIATPDEFQADPSVYDGIRFDEFGAPTTFYVLLTDDRTGARRFEPIPARDFVWLPHMTKPGQARPPSCYTTIFDWLAHLNRYIDGVSLAAWMATVFGLIIKQENPSRQLNSLGYQPDSQGVDRRTIVMENGQVKFTGTTGEVAQVQAHQPMQQTPEFMRAMWRAIGQPFDMPLEVFAKDMSTCTFASARIGLIPYYNSCNIKTARFGSRWSRTIKWWLSREAHRSPDDPKRWKNEFPDDFWKHELLPNAREYTDPVQEPQADLLQIDMKTKSPQMVIAERGRSKEKILRDIREWEAQTKDLPKINSNMTRHPQTGVGATGDPLGKEQVEPPKPAAPDTKKEAPNGE